MSNTIKGKVLLGVTGSVAATVAGKLANLLLNNGFDTRIMATENSFYFTGWTEDKFMAEACGMRFPVKVYTRQDEFTGQGYQKNQAVTHIDLGVWADVLLIAPVDALTIGKMANGLPDNLVASTYLAWPMEKPIILAPAMNTRMWEHPAVQENIAKLRKWHQDCLTLFVPVTKRLACGETGVGAMADIGDIVRAVEFYLS